MVSAVILGYNRSSEVLITIEKLTFIKQVVPFPMEIIVVDNASADNTTSLVQATHPDVTLITRRENNGIAGWNDGFTVAKYKYLLVLDDDSHIESGLAEGIAYLEDKPDIGVLALNITGGTYETSDWKDLSETIGFIGCGAIIKKEVYDKIGGFGEWLHVYAHEWEYSLRCLNAGYKVVFFKNSSVIHRTSKLNRTNKRLRFFTTKNEMSIVYKHFSYSRCKYLVRVWVNNMKVIKTEGLAAAYYCFKGGIEFFKTRKQLAITPVSREVQLRFAKVFWGTQPIFDFIERKLKRDR